MLVLSLLGTRGCRVVEFCSLCGDILVSLVREAQIRLTLPRESARAPTRLYSRHSNVRRDTLDASFPSVSAYERIEFWYPVNSAYLTNRWGEIASVVIDSVAQKNFVESSEETINKWRSFYELRLKLLTVGCFRRTFNKFKSFFPAKTQTSSEDLVSLMHLLLGLW